MHMKYVSANGLLILSCYKVYYYFGMKLRFTTFFITYLYPTLRKELYNMKMLRKHFLFALSAIILIFLVLYYIWNNMSLYGDWIIQATEVNIEWYDYQGFKHLEKLSNSDKAELVNQLENISEKHKLFYPPKSRTGELNYNIYCYGVKKVHYTMKSSGVVIVQNMNFPYQYSIWNINQESIAGIINYIKNIENK